MRLVSRLSNSKLARPSTLVPLVSILAVVGPVIVVSAGVWDAVSHLQKEPELFWSIQHMAVYAGVSITACAAIMGCIIFRQAAGMRTGIKLVIAGSIIQLISGFGDSLSHEMFGIDGLVSWSHQPLELGLVLASLGGVLIIKQREHTRLGALLPFAAVSFIFFTVWLGFNLALIPGHVLLCMPVYEIFSSGCAVL
ncbi:MAG: hypothetical protein EB829_02075 [Nitrosopumilus sp. H8]|nr:MAG: hypothetical protein EB829_02075 [Nitrosopumilus sp. H8]